MKIRTDFVSNSSSSCYMVPVSKTHSRVNWHKNTLRPFPDNKKLQMRFDDFSYSNTWSTLEDNWAFLCSQLIYWTIADIIDGTSKTKKFLLRELYNSADFIKINEAVISYFKDLGIECSGIELDEEEITDVQDDGSYRILRPQCNIDHDSIFEGLDDMMKKSKCDSVAELIWGIKEIIVSWS